MVKPEMLREEFSETTEALHFEVEYDDTPTRQINSDPLFLPDEEMYEDEDDVNTMLVVAVNPEGGNQDMNSHSDGVQPNPLPADNWEFGNDGERPVRVRV
jgi:hypothetical protein